MIALEPFVYEGFESMAHLTHTYGVSHLRAGQPHDCPLLPASSSRNQERPPITITVIGAGLLGRVLYNIKFDVKRR